MNEEDYREKFCSKLEKKFSCLEDYHQKFYYTKLVQERIKARKNKTDIEVSESGNNSGLTTGPRAIAEDILSVREHYGHVNKRLARQWFLGSNESSLAEDPDLHEKNTRDPNNQSSFSMETSQERSMDPDFRAVGILTDHSLSAETWGELIQSSAGKMSSESITSEDSVFSEDYTAMTEVSDMTDVIRRPEKTPPDGGSEVDSSFCSPCSSTSTLEADGMEDGGNVEVDGKDKVTECESKREGKTRPNVKLLLDQPVIELETDPSPPPNEEMEVASVGEADPVDFSTGTKAQIVNSDSTSFYEDREFDFLKTEPVRRSTSLKTYKTPPGTPSRKKAVRFADALGLDLESVRHILNLEEPPVVPKSAMRDLKVGLEEAHTTEGVKYLSALFSQPGVSPGFFNRIQTGKVALENCIVNDTDMTISGTIRVANISYHKTVIVRYTTNSWVSSDDIVASYVLNSNDGQTDRFSFTLNVPKYFAVGQRLEIAVLFSAAGQNFWDNNYGKNYIVECYARAMPVSQSDNSWMHFL